MYEVRDGVGEHGREREVARQEAAVRVAEAAEEEDEPDSLEIAGRRIAEEIMDKAASHGRRRMQK